MQRIIDELLADFPIQMSMESGHPGFGTSTRVHATSEIPSPPPPPPPQPSTPPSGSPVLLYPDLNEFLYMYNKTIMEHHKSMQRIFDSIGTRIPATELRYITYYMNQNICEYHRIIKHSLDLLFLLYHEGTTPLEQQRFSRVDTGTNTTTHATNATVPPPPRLTRPSSRTSLFNPVFLRTPPSDAQSQTRGLTTTQIEEFTDQFFWDDDVNQENITIDACGNEVSANTCPISLEEFRHGDSISRIRACGHQFKTESLQRWFQRNRRCPVCRRDAATRPPETPQYRRQPNLFDTLASTFQEAFSDASLNQQFTSLLQRYVPNDMHITSLNHPDSIEIFSVPLATYTVSFEEYPNRDSGNSGNDV